MKNIICRNKEIGLLSSLLASSKSEFVAIFGRRRIGKTYLVTEFFEQQDCLFFYLVGIRKAPMERQLWAFQGALADCFYDGSRLEKPKDWFDAFEQLNKVLQKENNKKMVLFFDELPWLATAKSEMLEALDYFWNRYWSHQHNVKVIICGSAAAWMIDNVIDDKGGLHNRVTKQIHMMPFNLSETKIYLTHNGVKLTNSSILEIVQSVGGVPYYLNMIQKGLSASENIDHLFFEPNSELSTEFERLFHSLYDNAEAYIELVEIIAQSRFTTHQMLVKKAKLTSEGGTLSSRLDELEKSGFIRSFLPYGKNRGKVHMLIDEYVLFFLKWVKGQKRKQLVLSDGENYWQDTRQTQSYKSWSGYSFEVVCFKHLSQIRKKLKLPANSHAYSWSYVPKKSDEKGAQIDCLFDRPDGCITFCEIKNTEKPYKLDKAAWQNMEHKQSLFAKHCKVDKEGFWCLISKSGVLKNDYVKDNISQVIVLDDLFS